jgi:hypothetical protein
MLPPFFVHNYKEHVYGVWSCFDFGGVTQHFYAHLVMLQNSQLAIVSSNYCKLPSMSPAFYECSFGNAANS